MTNNYADATGYSPHFSGNDSLKKVKSSDSMRRKEIEKKLNEIFGESELATTHREAVPANFDLIKELATNHQKREEFLEPFSPSLNDIEAAKGKFVSNRVLVRFTDGPKDGYLSYIPGRGISFSNVSKQLVIQPIQLAIKLKRYILKNNIDKDGTVTVTRTEELYPANIAKLKDPERCIEQKKYIIHTSHPTLGPEEVAVEVQIALKTQAEIDAEQGAAPSKKSTSPKRWASW
jgi:hypothetical protein